MHYLTSRRGGGVEELEVKKKRKRNFTYFRSKMSNNSFCKSGFKTYSYVGWIGVVMHLKGCGHANQDTTLVHVKRTSKWRQDFT